MKKRLYLKADSFSASIPYSQESYHVVLP